MYPTNFDGASLKHFKNCLRKQHSNPAEFLSSQPTTPSCFCCFNVGNRLAENSTISKSFKKYVAILCSVTPKPPKNKKISFFAFFVFFQAAFLLKISYPHIRSPHSNAAHIRCVAQIHTPNPKHPGTNSQPKFRQQPILRLMLSLLHHDQCKSIQATLFLVLRALFRFSLLLRYRIIFKLVLLHVSFKKNEEMRRRQSEISDVEWKDGGSPTITSLFSKVEVLED